MQNLYVIESINKPIKVSILSWEPNSRYKVTQLQINTSGSSKMVKTQLVNIETVAKDLHTTIDYLIKFVGYELNTKSKIDKSNKAYIAGKYEPLELSKVMEKFIDQIILCPKCRLPEIILEKKEDIMGNCRSCGSNTILNIKNDKFKSYIGKNIIINTDKTFVDKSDDLEILNDKDLPKDEDVIWFSDTSLEAVKERKAKFFN